MPSSSNHPDLSPHLQKILDRHRREAERLREKYGDPDEAPSTFVREHFDREALEESARDAEEGASFWIKDAAKWEEWRKIQS